MGRTRIPSVRMYRVEILPIARRDLVEIARYVATTLGSSQAAEQLSEKLIDGINSLESMPYRRAVYTPLKHLGREYRALQVEGYLIFYWVDEEEQLVTVARVIYAKADIAERF